MYSEIPHCAFIFNFNFLKLILEKLQYTIHEWNISGYLKVIALFLGLQLRYNKVLFFLESVGTEKNNFIRK